ncbi:hypothetical protein [Streptomyces oceani]|uniref:hypothetical protein n=1 Tax=Streptomyces oceani TaxID=1075402 RepID=UPI001480E653|nr:hypothetical protein [Streptomyces oceani]
MPGQPAGQGAGGRLAVSASAAAEGTTGPRGTRARKLSCTLVLSVAGLLVAGLVTSTFVFDLLPGTGGDTQHGDQPPAASEKPSPSGGGEGNGGNASGGTGGSGDKPSDEPSDGEVASVPQKFVGTWRGDLRTDSGLPGGTMTITIKEGGVGDRIATGVTKLASLECHGGWTLGSATERKLVTEASVPEGQTGCSDGGAEETFSLRQDGSLRYESNDDPAGNTEGTLRKVK